MKVRFLGAAHEVTGSCTFITVGGKNIVVDYGMEQGINLFKNEELPVPEKDIDCVFLTHAHIDHSGMLPLLYKKGFRGPVYATRATCSLCEIMLRDCAHIQVSDAEYNTRKAKRAGNQPVEPIYDLEDTEGFLKLMIPVSYDEKRQINENVDVRFTDVGHLLGSAAIELWLHEDGEEKKIVFSGDVGNIDQPIICDPKRVAEADYLVIESTYGDRTHGERQEHISVLADYIQRTLDRGGNVIIPSFAVGRTQEILYFIREIKEKKLVKGHEGFPVYVDSPLALEATRVFLQCDMEYLDEMTREVMEEGKNPLVFDGLYLNTTTEESKELNNDKTPKIIISASGMCEGGRVRHHLKYNLWRPECLILFVGYQSVGTLGRIIYDGAKKVKLFGDEIAVRAEVGLLPGVSGHADKEGLLNWLDGFEKKPEMVFVNHGEPASCEEFVRCLNEDKGLKAFAPYSGTEFDLKEGRFTIITEGIPINKEKASTAKRNAAFEALMDAVEKLRKAAQSCEGMANKELKKFTSQIMNIINGMKK